MIAENSTAAETNAHVSARGSSVSLRMAGPFAFFCFNLSPPNK